MSRRISVITTVYNGERYLDRAVPSILQQEEPDFEFLIVNDGSTDGTAELLNDAASRDRRIRVLTPGRIGFVDALNFAIARASGEYIARQDFDDISYPRRLRLQSELLDRDASLGFVGGWYVVSDDNRHERYIRETPTVHTQIVAQMARCIPFAHTLTMFRKQAWEKVGGYPAYDDIEDLHFWVSMVKYGYRTGGVPEPLGEHWVHAQSFWHSSFHYAERQRKLARAQLRAIRELGLPAWTRIFPAGRLCYAIAPDEFKKAIRRRIAGSKEFDLTDGALASNDSTAVRSVQGLRK